MSFVNGKTYRFINKYYSSHALNVFGTNAASTGRNVCLFKDDDTDIMQDWVVKTSGSGYRMHSAVNQSFVLDCSDGSMSSSYKNNAHLCATSQTSTKDSQVEFKKVGDNVYKIYLPGKGLYLTATNTNTPVASSIGNADALAGGTGGQSNVYWASNSTSTKQQWIVSPEVDGGTTPDPEPGKGQKLIYPFQKQYYTVGYKNDAPAYDVFEYGPHYANDFYASDDLKLYASGDGKIVGTRKFTSLGNVLAVQYDNVLNHNGKNIGSVIFRYCHLDSCVKTSGTVKKGEYIAKEGATGNGAGNGARYHLHLEVDTDTTYPLATPTEGGGVDTTLDPLSILYRSSSQTVAPDSDIGASSTDSAGRPWYNISKIRAIPIA